MTQINVESNNASNRLEKSLKALKDFYQSLSVIDSALRKLASKPSLSGDEKMAVDVFKGEAPLYKDFLARQIKLSAELAECAKNGDVSKAKYEAWWELLRKCKLIFMAATQVIIFDLKNKPEDANLASGEVEWFAPFSKMPFADFDLDADREGEDDAGAEI